jgi:hypothetical protein
LTSRTVGIRNAAQRDTTGAATTKKARPKNMLNDNRRPDTAIPTGRDQACY